MVYYVVDRGGGVLHHRWPGPPIVQSLTRSHLLLCNLVLPYILEPGAFLEVCAACVLLEVVHLVTIKQVAPNGSARRLPIYIFLKTVYNLILPYIVQPGWDISGSLRNLCAA